MGVYDESLVEPLGKSIIQPWGENEHSLYTDRTDWMRFQQVQKRRYARVKGWYI